VANESSKIVIVGGGFSGCCLAVNLVRRSSQPLAITIIESRPKLGQGLAYSTLDPEHRLNAPSFVHSLIPEEAWHFTQWCLDQRLADTDPQAARADGASYQRRSDFARYIEHTVKAHAYWPSTGSSITHLRASALAIRTLEAPAQRSYLVSTQDGRDIHADLVVCATGNHLPIRPTYLAAGLDDHPGVICNPFDGERLEAIQLDAKVLVVGAGLTALDALSTLIKQGHRGPITVASRHGLRPVAQGPMPPALELAKTAEGLAKLPGTLVIDRIMGPAPAFLADADVPVTVRAWLQALRQKTLESIAEGKTWHAPFDDLRDALWQLWPRLPASEKRRFLRHLRTLYDVHRYRTPPQNDEMVRAAEVQGQVQFRAARVLQVCSKEEGRLQVQLKSHSVLTSASEQFDAMVNCAGLDGGKALVANPLLANLLHAKLILPDSCAMGVEVDRQCRAVNALGQAQPGLRFIGPPTMGMFGDPIGAMFISAQIHRLIPDILQGFGAASANCR
jgi:uncharacterized NAD(P)/FAD-binding protein YdhS